MKEKTCSTGEAAKKIGVSYQTLHDWIENAEIPVPMSVPVGKKFIFLWTEADIERARKIKGTLKKGPKGPRTKKK